MVGRLTLLLWFGWFAAVSLAGEPTPVPLSPCAYEELAEGLSGSVRLKVDHGLTAYGTEQENQAFLDWDGNGDGDPQFFHLENAVLKSLNDHVLGDRELSQAVVGLYKSILFENLDRDSWARLYNDYKGVRLLYLGDESVVRPPVVEAYHLTGARFALGIGEYLNPQHWLRSKGNRLVTNPETWFLGGVGRTPEEAAWASRLARKYAAKTGDSTMVDFQDPATLKEFQQRFANAQSRRLALEEKFGSHPGLMRPVLGGGQKILTTRAVDILRKADLHDINAGLDELAQQFKNRIGVELSRQDVFLLVEYMSYIDGFAPPINTPWHDSIGLEGLDRGFMAVDIAGQNVRNLNRVMSELARAESLPRGTSTMEHRAFAGALLAKLREGQDLASLNFDGLQADLQGGIGRAGILGDKGTGVRLSGDDLIFAPAHRLTGAERLRLIRELGRTKRPSAYRTVFVPGHYEPKGSMAPVALDAHLRGEIVVIGDSILKNLRVSSEKVIASRRRRKLVMAVDVRAYESDEIGVLLRVMGPVTEGETEYLQEELHRSARLAEKEEGIAVRVLGLERMAAERKPDSLSLPEEKAFRRNRESAELAWPPRGRGRIDLFPPTSQRFAF